MCINYPGCLLQCNDDLTMIAAVGLIGDLYRTANDSSQPIHGDYSRIISVLLCLLQNPAISRDLKPVCLGSLSDIILCIQTCILPWLEPVLQVLGEAGRAVVETQSAAPDYCEELAKAVLDTFSSVIQSLHSQPEFRNLFQQSYQDNVLALVLQLQNLFPHSEDLFLGLCGLIGDVFQHFHGSDVNVDSEQILKLLEEGMGSVSSKVRRIAGWAASQVHSGKH